MNGNSELVCSYCAFPTEKVSGDRIYPHRPDLASKVFWLCAPCHAYVGCHPGTDRPLGRVANAELRRAKQRAHASFDPIWKNGHASRKKAYAVLAEKLGIPVEDCHIGMFDVEMCERVVSICDWFGMEGL